MRKKNISLIKKFSAYADRIIEKATSHDKRQYRSAKKNLTFWLENHHSGGKFTKLDARDYSDWYSTDKKNTTKNSRLTNLRRIFDDMVLAEEIFENPFQSVKNGKVIIEAQRILTDSELKIISNYLRENSAWVFYAFLLHYYCFIRSTELCRLRRKDFDLNEGVINVSDKISKRSGGWVTIPVSILPFFCEKPFTDIPNDFLIFGRYLKPHESKALYEETLGKKYKKILLEMHEKGLIENIDGLSFYRVKHTGITHMANDPTIAIVETSKQARHKNLATTMLYYQKPKISENIRKYTKIIV